MSDVAFPRSRRVLAGADFSRTFAEGSRFSSRYFRLHWCPTTQPARLGLAVSRKVSPRAVERNRIKRCVRESFRHACAQLPPGDAVLVAYRDAVAAEPAQLRAELQRAWRRIAALPPSHAQGTIRPASAGSGQPRDSIPSEAIPSPADERPAPAAPMTPDK